MKYLILLLLPLLACSTPYARQWESRLWDTPAENGEEEKNIGRLQTEELRFNVVCTQFRQVLNLNNSVLAIGVHCRNESGATYSLQFNPIQVFTERHLIVQPMPLDHVMYKFYGGDLRSAAQIDRSSQPYERYPGTPAGDMLAGIINLYRAYENQAIITELARKEALPHDLYYNSFTPTSVPPGGAVQWIQYYPGTSKPIKVMIEGHKLESAVIFEKPPPAPPPKPVGTDNRSALVLVVMFTIVGGFYMIVSNLSD